MQEPKTKIKNPNFFTYTSQSWLTPLLIKGKKAPLTADDLYEKEDKNSSNEIAERFTPYLERVIKRQSSLKYEIFKFMWIPLFGLVTSAACVTAANLSSPLLVQKFIDRIQSGYDNSQFFSNGYILAISIFLLQLVVVFGTAFGFATTTRNTILCQAALVSAVYQKSLRLSSKSRSEFSSGRIMTMITSDIPQVCFFYNVLGDALMFPIQFFMAIFLMYYLVGPAVFYSFIVLGCSALASYVSGRRRGDLFKNYFQTNDKRLTIVRDMILGIQMIKFRALESEFYKKNLKIRTEQLSNAVRIFFNNAFVQVILFSNVNLLIVAVIGGYSQNHVLTASIVYPVIGYCSSLVNPMGQLLNTINTYSVGAVSLQRISEFLHAEEFERDGAEEDIGLISLEGVTYQWPEEQAKEKKSNNFKLDNIDLTIEPGTLVAVVGSIGSGKSTLVSGLLNELEKKSGTARVCGKIAYCPQVPWISSGTIEENILLGSPLDAEKIEKVVYAVGLNKDFEILENGIKTKLGENGVTLSGGQKARVSLARALYADSDIYLLDCPLAALDAKVSKLVFENAIKGYLKQKTVVMITHNQNYLNQFDRIVLMEQGKIVQNGKISELLEISDGPLAQLMQNATIEEVEEEEKKVEETKTKTKEAPAKEVISKEDQEKGSVKGKLYLQVFKICGAALIPLVIGVLCLFSTNILTPLTLTTWVNNASSSNQTYYSIIFQVCGIGVLVSMIIEYGSTLLLLLRIVKYLHDGAIRSLLGAPKSFFDANPAGRIVSRLGGDLELLDVNTAQLLVNLFGSTSNFLTVLILSCQATWYMLIAYLVLAYPTWVCFLYYSASNIELRRILSVTRSPLVSCYSETLGGLTTIRAFNVEKAWIRKQRMCLDDYQSSTYIFNSISIWLRFRIGLVCSIVTLIIGLVAADPKISPSMASYIGLSLTYASQIAGAVAFLMISNANGEAQMNSIERLIHYADNLPQEPPAKLATDPKNWPFEGKIEVESLSVAYDSAPEIDVVKDLSFKITPGEKVGIVGRTGSGKTTFVSSLFRINNNHRGKITIDGIEIASLGLATLRRGIFMVPQEPVLFQGTVRSNIDPRSEYSDEKIWAALEVCGLKSYISSLEGGLEYAISKEGSNFSAGQKQLLCIVGAILEETKILVFDEATSALDANSDEIIQDLIQNHLKNSTIITVAHRLNTIATYDKILVLDQGKMVEYDSPLNLLTNEKSLFHELANATGPANFELLKKLAGRN
ncbi:hypothetical protein HDV01_003049 [Terramyces sp. JEL0728]|nr:hypothetical protein HDV01_003049 [Terramyces sp. JEL0728]